MLLNALTTRVYGTILSRAVAHPLAIESWNTLAHVKRMECDSRWAG